MDPTNHVSSIMEEVAGDRAAGESSEDKTLFDVDKTITELINDGSRSTTKHSIAVIKDVKLCPVSPTITPMILKMMCLPVLLGRDHDPRRSITNRRRWCHLLRNGREVKKTRGQVFIISVIIFLSYSKMLLK